MTLKVKKEGEDLCLESCQFFELQRFVSETGLDLTFEWKEGQYWLSSDDPRERPIGVMIDRELERHEAFFKKRSILKDPLARAVGVKAGYRPRVLDLTAGLLGDSLLLLSYGLEVWATERHPVVRFLVESALQNAHHPQLKAFHFLPGNALDILGTLETEAIYFDPMFEEVNEKSSPRKEMRIFRQLIKKDLDAPEVLKHCLALKGKRVVVKRPLRAPPLIESPQVEYCGKSTRYDVYFSAQKD